MSFGVKNSNDEYSTGRRRRRGHVLWGPRGRTSGGDREDGATGMGTRGARPTSVGGERSTAGTRPKVKAEKCGLVALGKF